MTALQSIILGFVQGITEFLPISSSGHLVLMENLFGQADGGSLAFDAMLHMATVAAIIVYFRKDIWVLFQALLRKLGRLPVNETELTMVYALLLSTIPAVIGGLLLEKYMNDLFRNPMYVAGALLAGSALFIYAEWRYYNKTPQQELTVRTGIKIGLFQCLALIPGFSRSGAVISGGMLVGLTRSESARFGFLMAVPLLLGAGAKKMLELISSKAAVDWAVIGFGSLTAFLVGLFAIHFMLSFVRRYSLWPFIWYRVALAIIVIYIFAGV